MCHNERNLRLKNCFEGPQAFATFLTNKNKVESIWWHWEQITFLSSKHKRLHISEEKEAKKEERQWPQKEQHVWKMPMPSPSGKCNVVQSLKCCHSNTVNWQQQTTCQNVMQLTILLDYGFYISNPFGTFNPSGIPPAACHNAALKNELCMWRCGWSHCVHLLVDDPMLLSSVAVISGWDSTCNCLFGQLLSSSGNQTLTIIFSLVFLWMELLIAWSFKSFHWKHILLLLWMSIWCNWCQPQVKVVVPFLMLPSRFVLAAKSWSVEKLKWSDN